jgi:hypothetical protein
MFLEQPLDHPGQAQTVVESMVAAAHRNAEPAGQVFQAKPAAPIQLTGEREAVEQGQVPEPAPSFRQALEHWDIEEVAVVGNED